jgi:hypothetical protein
VQIELSDHVGESPDGKRVDHGQWIVFCDGVQVGYLSKKEGAWLQCIVSMNESTKAELIEAVSEAAKVNVGGAALPVDPDLMPQEEGEDE